MRTLCINTAAEPYFFALYDDGALVFEECFLAKYFDLENLGEYLVNRLESLALLPIDQIAVVRGPGKYTALRLGLTAAKALGYCWKVPVVGVESMSLLASSCGMMDKLILSIFHLRAKQVYVALYKKPNDRLEMLSEPFLSDESGVLNLSKKLDPSILFVSQKNLNFNDGHCRIIHVRPLSSLAMINSLSCENEKVNNTKQLKIYPQALYVFEP